MESEEVVKLAAAVRDISDHREMLRSASKLFEMNAAPSSGTDAVISMARRVASLGSAGMICAMEGDVYGARAIARLVAEHWVRLMALGADIKLTGNVAAGEHYWRDLRIAEAIQKDRSLRAMFPEGLSPGALPESVHEQMSSYLVEPAPTREDYQAARATIDRYGFKRLVESLRDALPDRTVLDVHLFGSLLSTYSLLSGFVHGGPDAHEALRHDDWRGRTVAALDIATPWSSVLVYACAVLDRTGDGSDREPAVRELQRRIVDWYTRAEVEKRR